MLAILHGKSGTSSRGDRVPKSVAGKYAGSSKPSEDTPESKGKSLEGGKWTGEHHAKDKKKVDEKRAERKKKKKELKKAVEEFVKSRGYKGAGCIVVNKDGQILLGRRSDNGLWCTPGGHVDEGESFEQAALRELKEETGISAKSATKLHDGFYRGYTTQSFLVKSFRGKLKSNGEMLDLKFMNVQDIPWDTVVDYAKDCLSAYISEQLVKSSSLKFMIAQEELTKNMIRGGKEGVTYEITHGDALRVVGNGTFRMLREATKDMGDEDFREVGVDHYTLHIRKHLNDVYSGRIEDGHKVIHQFTNKSLPSVAAELMSVFEWYLPEDEGELEIADDIDDDVIEGGLQQLIDKYKQHNIVNIYTEMENIREEIRHGSAVDLQQVEAKMMKLFDKLEDSLLHHADKHNQLAEDAGKEIDELEAKLMGLQRKIEELGDRPKVVQAYSTGGVNHSQVHSDAYPYLSKPSVVISPCGKISITFAKDWTPMETEDFLKDLKAKVVK